MLTKPEEQSKTSVLTNKTPGTKKIPNTYLNDFNFAHGWLNDTSFNVVSNDSFDQVQPSSVQSTKLLPRPAHLKINA